jgi:trans-2,3-dihydro-3-hydroxyanthranilate isomerase
MARLTFYIVDVFAEKRYAGNQLAVVSDAGGLSDVEMQQIAKEMNYSETTFVLSREPRNGGYDVRIFTPQEEMPFAGHPTLGTAYIIQNEIIREPVGTVILNLKVGQIPVTFNCSGDGIENLWMKQIESTFGRMLDPASIAQVLNLDESEFDYEFPIEEISTGIPFIIVPLKALSSLERLGLARDKYFDLIEDTWAKAILAFCPETHHQQNDLSVRVFADYYGVPEDPATGSANGCLAGYLVKHRYFGDSKIDLRVEQGYVVGRPSLLLVRAEDNDGQIDISVGGNAIKIAKGELV